MPQNFYFRSVHKRWHRVLSSSNARAIICSPYLTPKTALSVIQASSPDRCEIYTRFSLEDFASGASSLQVVASLIKRGYRVFEIQALHAKVLLTSGEFVSIGSQNLTARGVRNREATYCSDDPTKVARVEAMLAPWLEKATSITMEMVEDALRLLGPLEKEFRKLQNAAISAENVVKLAQVKRDERARATLVAQDATLRRETEQQLKALTVRKTITKTAKSKLEWNGSEGQVPLDVAKAFIRRAAWWHSHSSGSLVRASGYANRITGVNGDWRVKFGANTFMVGRAIFKCKELVIQYIDGFETGSSVKPSLMIRLFRAAISGSVAGYDGIARGRYPVVGDDMMFGTLSIDVKYFIRELLELLPHEIAGPLKEENDAKP